MLATAKGAKKLGHVREIVTSLIIVHKPAYVVADENDLRSLHSEQIYNTQNMSHVVFWVSWPLNTCFWQVYCMNKNLSLLTS